MSKRLKLRSIVSGITDKPNRSNVFFGCRLMNNYKHANSLSQRRSKSRSDWNSLTSHSMYINTSVLSARSSRSAVGHPLKANNKCLLAFPDNETTLAAIEEPIPEIALDNILTHEDLKEYW